MREKRVRRESRDREERKQKRPIFFHQPPESLVCTDWPERVGLP